MTVDGCRLSVDFDGLALLGGGVGGEDQFQRFQVVLAGGFRLPAGAKAVDPVPLYGDHAVLHDLERRSAPTVDRGLWGVFGALFAGIDRDAIALIEFGPAMRPLQQHKGLREGVERGPGGVTGLDNGGRTARHLEQNRRDVLALQARVDALRLTGQLYGLAHEEAGDIEDMDTEIVENEARVFRKV